MEPYLDGEIMNQKEVDSFSNLRKAQENKRNALSQSGKAQRNKRNQLKRNVPF